MLKIMTPSKFDARVSLTRAFLAQLKSLSLEGQRQGTWSAVVVTNFKGIFSCAHDIEITDARSDMELLDEVDRSFQSQVPRICPLNMSRETKE
jgi:hypothetical protein